MRLVTAPAGYSLHRALRLLRDVWRPGEPRAVAMLDWMRPRGLFQPFGYTSDERYPLVFNFVEAQLGDGADLHILSFGCSTGEEVWSLRRRFSQAAITGADISRERIATCRRTLARRGGDPKITFTLAANTDAMAPGTFDAIFAMAVFRHGSLGTFPPTCRPLLRFAAFEAATAGLVRCLRPGGLLAFRYSNFRFSDTAAAAGFDLLLSLPAPEDTPVYGRDDRLLPRAALEPVVFRARAPGR